MTTLFVNGRIYTMERPGSCYATAVAVQEGRIVAVGDTEEIKLQLGRAGTRVIDLEGAAVIPGLIDNHLHLASCGMKLAMLDLSDAADSREMLLALRRWAEKTSAGEWIVGIGWNENRFADKRIPTIAELDEAAPNHPVLLTRICNHVYLANSLAFARAGITRETADPAGGAYGRDTAGNLNGLVYENASQPLRDAIPKPGYQELKGMLRRSIQHALASGLTSVHTEDVRELGSFADAWRMFRELVVGENLRLRSNLLIYHPHLPELRELGLTTGDGDEWVSVGALKIFADGALGGRTALLSRSYADAPGTYGTAIHTREELNEIAAKARAHGMPVAVHAIGDAAADLALTAMEQNPLPAHRHRLIHAQVLRPEQIERMRRLGGRLAVDIQPRFVASDFPWVQERIPAEWLPTCYAWKTLLDAGLLCGGGSDAPIEPIDPLLGLHAAVTRKRPGKTHDEYQPEQKLTIQQAVRLFTLGGTYATREEAVKGTIAPGKYADLTVLDRDIFADHPDVLLETNVIRTVIGGETVYEK
ncbi:amidohydrolase [Effusibacillus pohliae]|uniref:amidohydrolase n=1 Tax=Effusibacillus pohliae TaxID=232270 RepID=UPI00036F342D|nr:amidohydrolase [Effusibacillus pohliae]